MLHDVKKQVLGDLITHRIGGASFDEVVRAGDTICMCTNQRVRNKFLKEIEIEGKK